MSTAHEYLDALQDFLEERFGEEAICDVFVDEHQSGGVAANVMIQTQFDSNYVKQINVILVPEGTREFQSNESSSVKDPFDAARSIF